MAARKKRSRTSRRDRALIAPVMRILENGDPTKFVFEGACRAGLRSAFCLEGERWQWSDLRAAAIVGEALRRLGAERPSWQEGQPEWTQDGHAPLRRFYCAHCGRPIPDDRQSLGEVKYCDANCRAAAISMRKRRFGYAMERAKWMAAMVVRREDARTVRGRPCLHCGTKFVPTEWRAKGRNSDRYCSHDCYLAALATPKPCKICGTMFTPKRRTDAIYCSDSCKSTAVNRRRQAERPLRQCATCGQPFHPATPNSRYCSLKCVHNRQRGAANGNGHMNGKPADADENQAPQMPGGALIAPPPLPRHG